MGERTHYRRETLDCWARESAETSLCRFGTDARLADWASWEALRPLCFPWREHEHDWARNIAGCKLARKRVASKLFGYDERTKERLALALKAFDDRVNLAVSDHLGASQNRAATFEHFIEVLQSDGICFVSDRGALTIVVDLAKEQPRPPKPQRTIGPSCDECGEEQLSDSRGGSWYFYCVNDGCRLHHQRFRA